MAQVQIPHPLRFTVGPADIQHQSVANRFYPAMRPALHGVHLRGFGLAATSTPNWSLLAQGYNPYTGTTTGPQFVNPNTGGVSGPEGYPGPLRAALNSYYPGGMTNYSWAQAAHSPAASVPANVVQGTGGSAFVVYVNPDGSMGQSDQNMDYTAADTSFQAPAGGVTTWQQQVSNLGFAVLNAQWQATYQSLLQQAQAAVQANYPVAQPIVTSPVTGAPVTTTTPTPTAAPTTTVTTVPASTGTTPISYAPTLTFTDPSGNNLENLQLLVGQSWVITIRGAMPNAQVSVNGTHNGASVVNTMGTTDANGNWTDSGTFDSSVLGTWVEAWSVGGQQVGSFMFTVVQSGTTTGGTAPSTTPPVTTTGGGPSGTGAPGGGSPVSGGGTTPSGQWIAGIPNEYVMIGGGALVLLILLTGRR